MQLLDDALDPPAALAGVKRSCGGVLLWPDGPSAADVLSVSTVTTDPRCRKIAADCAERVLGRPADLVSELSAGRSSSAWVAQAGPERWVVRVPLEDSDRRITYRAEAAIGRYLTSLGHPVADWTLIEHDGVMCSVARELPGLPVAYGRVWPDDFGRQLANVLADLHAMPAEGFGPLADDEQRVPRGVSDDCAHGIADRWCLARIWPFDGSSLDDHPITEQAPGIARAAATLEGDITAAGTGAIGVVHSDLHREHLLVGNDGSLTGVLDFGDAFIGAIAWDFALLNWYFGEANAATVARHDPAPTDVFGDGATLSIAVGLYKLAKNPDDPHVIPRLRRCLEATR